MARGNEGFYDIVIKYYGRNNGLMVGYKGYKRIRGVGRIAWVESGRCSFQEKVSEKILKSLTDGKMYWIRANEKIKFGPNSQDEYESEDFNSMMRRMKFKRTDSRMALWMNKLDDKDTNSEDSLKHPPGSANGSISEESL
ncbi:hypothetical protein Tco_1079247 [Tanacetum coccineum]|uniref:Uncharacterized protein n=1 Tax=Tanacetum coccineum TaxID=301880 RepID=A0ABQ5HT05_9ASTR